MTGTDDDGDAIARPDNWDEDGPPPRIVMRPEAKGQAALAPGERVLARLTPSGPGQYEARTIKRLSEAPGRILGEFRAGAAGGRIVPTDRRARAEWVVPAGEEGPAQPGDLVLAHPLPHRGYGLKPARIVERVGRVGDAGAISAIVIATQQIPDTFDAETIAEAEGARGPRLGGREDLRDLGLVTIDGADARDFDDAVFAEQDADGFRLVVAIADVADYVRPGTALDREAAHRGNSCYFPDRVVPMLPEALSNGWCSLRPDEDRACVFVEMRIDPAGRKTGHRFGRGLMRSSARLTYEAVQAAADDRTPPPGLPGARLDALYAAFRALLDARRRRGTLDLDLPERVVTLDEAGRVASITPRPRLDSHRLIEEFMVLANVAAAEELEGARRACLYRVHAPPSEEKLHALRATLKGFGISLPLGRDVSPADLDRALRLAAGEDHALLVNELVLRAQSQAAYAPENIGHFGLALPRYAHFTSPIRRYADLVVHRALIDACKLGPGGADAAAASVDAAWGDLEALGTHLTMTERRAALAERDATDRYLAAYMADHTGERFEARISGVTRFGLFVTVTASGASGLVPISTLPDDFWMHDDMAQTLTGRRSGRRFGLAQAVTVRLREANALTGGLIFAIHGDGDGHGGEHSAARGEGGATGLDPPMSSDAPAGPAGRRDHARGGPYGKPPRTDGAKRQRPRKHR